MIKKSIFFGVWLILFAPVVRVQAQDTVDINLNVKHLVNGVSAFDRSKYVVFHDDLTGNEWNSEADEQQLLDGYDVYLGRNNGTIVWEWNNTREDSVKPGWPDLDYMQTRGTKGIDDYANNTFVHQFEGRYHRMMIGGQEHMFPHGQATSKGGLVYEGFDATAEFYAQYLKKFFGAGGLSGRPQPAMLEVINEPFVKANSLGTTREELARYHNVVAERVKTLNPEVMVGGYTAAHPAFEDGDFAVWNNNWKMFIDVAGANMDFFSFHLYDFVQDKTDMSQEMYRSGSNIEAIMDMINHYSYLKLGTTKPFAVSEYGWLCKTCDGGYDPKEDWYNLRSFNNMMVQLMERPDQIITAIPFMLMKANWAKPAGAEYNTYGPRLMREIGELPGETPHGGWTYTHLLKYYQFWSSLRGTRVDTKANDLDILADAYVDGNIAYVVLSNLNPEDHEINLKWTGLGNAAVQDVSVTQLYAVDDLPVLDTIAGNLEKVTLHRQATLIMKLNLSDAIVIDEENNEQTYFADKYLQSITAGKSMDFNINNVNLSPYGEATLRLGLGRDHGKSLHPDIVVNGHKIDYPADWRGYDQGTRDRFFGVLEIDIPYEYLLQNNKIALQFDDASGHVTSLAMQVFNLSKQLERSVPSQGITKVITSLPANSEEIFRVFPNPTTHHLYVDWIANQPARYTLVSISGREVQQGVLQPGRALVDMTPYEHGLYLLKVESGDAVMVRKIYRE